MAKKPTKNLIVGLDIGTSKVNALVGEVKPDGIEIIGIGVYPSLGLKRGVVVNIDATVDSIQQAVGESEHGQLSPVRSVYTGIAGNHIRSLNSHGIVAIQNQEVTHTDVERVIDAMKPCDPLPIKKYYIYYRRNLLLTAKTVFVSPQAMSGRLGASKFYMVTVL